VKIITYSEENPECSLSEISKYMAEDMGRLLAKSTIRIILQNKEDILRSFEAIPSKKASERKRLSAGDSASVMQPRKKQLKLTDLFKKT
jgi:hypothetical protein